ncbi:hypothetical protein K0B96_03305 [Horticoccus luteus]|uniref:Dam-replacing protein HTH domain-containing protein n=1 Tax=Horticoccus luteus TaxID=2862869 RepID=A0A8F9XHS7_9BACT|nr:DpnI domain-containing protein [Horticoccus luteus]QYM79660.1 hypothetical protein K0B96_03305 [Horticoccus luteus]
MDLQLPVHHGAGYKSASQIARRITEPWGASNLFCCACTSDIIEQTPANTHVTDFLCPLCVERYQLKSQKTKIGRTILGSNYQRMVEAILHNRTPNFFLLNYELPAWFVRNLLLIPRFAISPAVVSPRRPLSSSARRHEWVGYTLNISLIPQAAKIDLVVDGAEIERTLVREKYARIARLANLPPDSRGWTLDVLRFVEQLPAIFRNDDVYGFEPELSALHPENRHVRDKLRQQLQVLRDRGLLAQKAGERGIWHKIS